MLLLFSCQVMSDSYWPHGLQHAKLPCPSPSPRVCPSSGALNQWYHPQCTYIYILKCQPVLFKQFLSVSYTLVKLERQLKGIAILTTLFSMQIWGRLIDLFMCFALRFLKQKCCMILRQRFLTIFYAMGPFRSLVKLVDSFSK